MSWEKILKQDNITNILEQLKKFAEDKANEFFARGGGEDDIAIRNDKLKGKIDDDLFNELDKQVDKIWESQEDVNKAFDRYVEIINEYLDDEGDDEK